MCCNLQNIVLTATLRAVSASHTAVRVGTAKLTAPPKFSADYPTTLYSVWLQNVYTACLCVSHSCPFLFNLNNVFFFNHLLFDRWLLQKSSKSGLHLYLRIDTLILQSSSVDGGVVAWTSHKDLGSGVTRIWSKLEQKCSWIWCWVNSTWCSFVTKKIKINKNQHALHKL